uniref:Uncharacterized protein n=1 Tax=Setaria viridis TaxID=4556 RepID=A0A4U6V7X1_SETVI|nr:hypothetical protein SEVIR_3G112950v2 [Setaria viridis]
MLNGWGLLLAGLIGGALSRPSPVPPAADPRSAPLAGLSICCWVCTHPRRLRLCASCSQPWWLGMVGAAAAMRGFWVMCNESAAPSARRAR